MPFPFEHKCDFPECTLLTRGCSALCGGYNGCGEYRCVEHRRPPHHRCKELVPSPKDMIEIRGIREKRNLDDWVRLHKSLSKDLMIAQAEALRPGHTCDIAIPDASELIGKSRKKHVELLLKYTYNVTGAWGLANHHYVVTFDDDVKWMVRCRRLGKGRPGHNVLRMIMDSEMETNDALRRAGMRIPMTYRPPQLKDHPARVNWSGKRKICNLYFFIDYVDAKPFPMEAMGWEEKQVDRMLERESMTHEHVSTFIRSYAEQMVKLSTAKFDAIGSLYPCSNGMSTVGPMIQPGIGDHLPPYFKGPYRTNKERWTAAVDHHLDLILHHDNYDTRASETYILFLEVRDIIQDSEELGRVETEFYVYSYESKGGQMLIDESGEIVACLDWEWAWVTTKEEAFAAPLAFEGANWSNEINRWEEELAVAYTDLGRGDLADCVRGGRKYHMLQAMCYPGRERRIPFEYIDALRYLVTGKGKPGSLSVERNDAWWSALKKKFGEDIGYRTVKERESVEGLESHEK